MGTVLEDRRFACRLFRASPGVAALAVVSLALAIAASTTIFSVIHTVLLAPPIFANPSRLVVIWESNVKKGIARTPVAAATFRDWRENSRTLEDLELVAPGSPVTITGSGFPERANLQYATPRLFHVLGVRPAAGRFFPESDEINAIAPVILSYGLWQRRYGGEPSIAGRKIVVNGELRTVSGVLPKDFHLFDMDTDIWMPISLPDARSEDRSFRSWLIAVGRLKPGATLESAQAEMNVISRRIAIQNPGSNKDWTAKVETVQEAQFGGWKGVLYPLWGTVIFVLLISCANIANLFLGRLATRSREISVRASLGATRGRLIVQLVNEGLLIGLAGGGLGFLLTDWGIHLFVAFAPGDFPLLDSIRPNPTVLLFCLATSLASGVLLAIVPALVGTRVDLNTALKRGARSTLGGQHGWFRGMFATVQIAFSVTLLVGAGLMIRSLLGVLRIDPGFRTQQVVTMQVFLAGPRYFLWRPDGVRIHDEVASFYGRLLERIETLPAVQSAAIVSWLPEMGYNTGRRDRTFRIIGKTEDASARAHVADFNAISEDYFRTLQIPLLAGRPFERTDTGTARWVAIVNRTFAERYLPGENAIGKQILTGEDSSERPREIVGVVADVRQDALEKKPEPEIFAPYRQQPPVAAGHGYQNRVHMNLVVRTWADSDATVAEIRNIAAQMDGNQPIYAVRTMSTVLAQATALRRLHATLLEIFASFALFLSAVGLYGVVSQSVSEKTAEVGLRMALGATPAKIRQMFFLQGLKLILSGLVAGLALGLALS
ncbi:MAG: ABC transporter permease, partial [Bryobacteraceae bacterium]